MQFNHSFINMKIIYNYITTNKINGKQYIGSHSTNNVDDGYLGSGSYILRAIKKYGKENFIRELICECKNEKQAYKNEKKYIEKYNTLSPNGYNLSPTGGLEYNGYHSEESKRKISEAQKGEKGNMYGKHHSEKTKKKLSDFFKGRKLPEEIREKMCGEGNGFYGKTHSEETKRKVSETNKGNKYSFGRKVTKETKRKMSEAKNGKKLTKEHVKNAVEGRAGYKHSEETKKKISESLRNRGNNDTS